MRSPLKQTESKVKDKDLTPFPPFSPAYIQNDRAHNNSIEATGNKPLRFFARLGCPRALFLSFGNTKNSFPHRETMEAL
jgi:hypothetical protein